MSERLKTFNLNYNEARPNQTLRYLTHRVYYKQCKAKINQFDVIILEFMMSASRFKIPIFLVIFSLVFAVAQCGGLKETRDLSERFPKIPVVFHPSYDISFFGLEKLHPLDSKKYGKVFNFLVDELNRYSNLQLMHCVYIYSRNYNKAQFYTPDMISDEDLLKVHTPEYLIPF